MCSNLLINVTFQLGKGTFEVSSQQIHLWYWLLKNNKRINCSRQSLDLSLASAVLGEIDPRFVPILQSPLQLQPPRPSLCHPLLPTTVNTRFCGWLLVPQSTMSSQNTQNYSKKVKAAITHLVNLHLWASCTSLSGFPFQLQKCGRPEVLGKCKGAIHL